jgi:glutathione S-transferase
MSNQNSYQLFLSQRSPFARRVRLALSRLSLPFEERFINVFDHNPDLVAANPLAMVPTLVTPEGSSFFDSSVILENLHDLTGGIWPSLAQDRIRIRQASALAAGLIQSTVAYFQETSMHDVPSPTWAKDHYETVKDTLRVIHETPRHLWVRDGVLTQAGWDLAVALEYLEIRIPSIPFRDNPGALDILNLASQDLHFAGSRPKL